MRALLAIACLLTALSLAPSGEASCHFCLQNTMDACASTGSDGTADACLDNVTYMAGHMPGHVVETACGDTGTC